MVYVGIDVAKATIEVAVSNQGKETALGEFNNNPSGFKSMDKALKPYLKDGIHLIAEPTGNYHLALIGYAHEKGWSVSLLNPKVIRDWNKGQGQRAKSDPIDARLLARYGAKEQPTPQQSLPDEVAILEALLNRKDILEKNLRQELNRLESFNHLSIQCDPVLDDFNLTIEQIRQSLSNIQSAIKEHLKQHPHLKELRARLLQIPGIGDKSVLPILVFLYRWDSHTCSLGTSKGLTAFAGLDPVPHSSGSSVFKPSLISKMGDSNIRRLLFMCALGGQKARDSVLIQFYQRLLQRGKPKKVALVASARKILSWAFGVFRSGASFDPKLASPNFN